MLIGVLVANENKRKSFVLVKLLLLFIMIFGQQLKIDFDNCVFSTIACRVRPTLINKAINGKALWIWKSLNDVFKAKQFWKFLQFVLMNLISVLAIFLMRFFYNEIWEILFIWLNIFISTKIMLSINYYIFNNINNGQYYIMLLNKLHPIK